MSDAQYVRMLGPQNRVQWALTTGHGWVWSSLYTEQGQTVKQLSTRLLEQANMAADIPGAQNILAPYFYEGYLEDILEAFVEARIARTL